MHPASTLFTGALMRVAGSVAAGPVSADEIETTLVVDDDGDAFLMSDPSALHVLQGLAVSVARIEIEQKHLARQVERLVEDLEGVQSRSHEQSKRLAQIASDSQVAEIHHHNPNAPDRGRRRVVAVSATAGGTIGTALGLLLERLLALLF